MGDMLMRTTSPRAGLFVNGINAVTGTAGSQANYGRTVEASSQIDGLRGIYGEELQRGKKLYTFTRISKEPGGEQKRGTRARGEFMGIPKSD